MTFNTVCCIFIFLPFMAPTQQSTVRRIDSLTRLLDYSNFKDDSEKVNALTRLCEAYGDVDHEKATAFGLRAQILAEKLNWRTGIRKADIALASARWAKGDYANALALEEKALDLCELAHDKAHVMACIGADLFGETRYSQALVWFQKGLAFEPENAELLEDIAMTYGWLKEYGKAVLYYRKAVSAYSRQGMAVNVSRCQYGLGCVFALMDRADDAKTALSQSMAMSMGQKDTLGYATALEQLALFDRSHGKDQQGISSLKRSLSILTSIDAKGELVENNYLLGETFLSMAKAVGPSPGRRLRQARLFDTAFSYLRQAVTLARPVSTWNERIKYEKLLCEASILAGRRDDAVLSLENYTAYSDSLFNKQTQEKFTENLLTYEFNRQRDSLQRQTDLEHLRRRTEVFYSVLAGGLIILAMAALLLYNRFRHLRLKSRLNDITFAALRAQMNPHFIFNCLNSIKLFTEQNNAAAASDYLTRFSRLIRAMLQNSRRETISLQAELELLRLYLEMEALRFKEKLQFIIDVEPGVSTDFIEIPSMLIQPYVENAIWHGLMHKENGGNVTIRVRELASSSTAEISIQDDGIGRAAALALRQQRHPAHQSYGLDITGERIRLVNEKYKTHAAVVITDLYNPDGSPAGTLVTLIIPI